MTEWAVTLVEAALAGAAGYAAWRARGRKFCILFGIAFGVLFLMLLHTFGFGVLRIEGPGGERDVGLLVGFGIIAGVMLGFPLGLLLGVGLYQLKPAGTPKPGPGPSGRLDV